MKKFSLLSAFIIYLLIAPIVRALDVPNFPTCSNPQGVLTVSYDSGVHGIAGNPGTFEGSDKVYSIDDTRGVQCFCSIDGSGIQTNWWKISSLDGNQVDTLKNLGWTFIPDGSVWGLEQTEYMAQNTNYSCNSNSNSGNVQSSSSSNSSNQTSEGQVLGLAYTGGAIELYGTAILSIFFFILGLLAFKKSK